IAYKLKELGYLSEVGKSKVPYSFEVTLALNDAGDSKITDVKRVSKPGRRLYAGAVDTHSVKNGMGARIMSTPKGILSDREARRLHVGGEELFKIW
ncbi:MAG: 30S ribosomal protein S8, partial [Patescibacteria group bacterium]